MKKIELEALQGSKIYFTEADGLGQQLYGIRREDLILKLKLWLLLSDHIMLAGSHIFESESTAHILREHPLLLESGIFVPDLRNECRDFTEYVKLKQEERDPGFLQKDTYKLIELAEFLNEHSNKVVPWKASPVSEAWRDSLVKDLLDKESVLRRRLIGVSIDSLQRLIWELGNTSFLTRKLIAYLAEKYLGRKRVVLIKHANFLYYLWGAAHLESEPVLHPEAFEWGRDKLITSTRRLVRTDELPLFRTTLREFGVSDLVLERLPISVIVELRKEETAIRFRNKWHRAIEEAKRSGRIEDDSTEVQNAEAKLFEMIMEAIGEEKKRRRWFREGKKWLSIGSFVTSVITSFVTNPVLGFAALLLELSAIDPLLGALECKLGGTEISLLCTRLQDSASEA